MSSIFDIFSTQPAQDAANSQVSGLTSGYNLASGDINSAIQSLAANYGAGTNALNATTGAANTALSQNYGAASGALNQGYGTATNALNSNYTSALQPYLKNYGNANAGVTQLGNVLGLNGQAGNASAMQALENTPGYQWQKQQGDSSINAAAAANGTLNSGNQLLALSNYNQGLASTTYNNYVSQLQPYLNQANTAAGGIANTYTGLGTGLANTATGNATAQANLSTGLGNATSSNLTGLGSNLASTATNLGNQTASQYDSLGQLAYATETGKGNAQANADLSAYTASGNFWNMAQQTAKTGAAMFSDERLKEDIERVGELVDGQPVYKYRYIGDNVFRIGLMAQDVEKTNPDAVTEIGGYKAVNYDKATRFAGDLSRFLEAA